MKEDKKKIFIRTFGCQMNVRDSEVISGLLKREGYALTADQDKADIILLNTCSVRQHAEDRVWSALGKYKAQGHSWSPGANQVKKKIIGLIGCMAQHYKEKVFDRAPNVDFIVGPSDIHKIPEILKKLSTRFSLVAAGDLFERKIWETDGEIRPEEIYHTGFYQDKEQAYIVISEGCSNYCSYCVVPYVRRELRNRNYKDILKEIEEAVNQGITKFTLLGQNVNAYQFEDVNFVNLVNLVNLKKGVKEFSFMTSHPKDTTIELFRAMTQCDKLKKYLHLPLQSGSDRILKLMNRGYTKKIYLDLVESYRKIVKNGILTTDIIVGFPGEKEEDFQETYALVREIGSLAAFIFKYSPRPKTPAANLDDDVALKEKKRRHALILTMQKKMSKTTLAVTP